VSQAALSRHEAHRSPSNPARWLAANRAVLNVGSPGPTILTLAMGSLIKKRRKRMRKKKHKKMLKRTRWQRRAAGK
jgi:hypothetical protein